MDIKLILSTHYAWKVKFMHAVFSGKPIDSTDIKKDDRCDAGKWLHGEGKLNYGHLPSYETCINRHAEFHIEAAKIASTINEKKFTEAKKLLSFDSDFSLAARELWIALKQLKQEIHEKNDMGNINVSIPDDRYWEFECLTNLIQEIDNSQDFNNAQELIANRFFQDKDK